ncbi:MAG: magnesium/cobalt transporter CorA [Burkholderiales bacterium]|nr:magnesium/cobalt transporter CorA [Burkholderiales bacterium]
MRYFPKRYHPPGTSPGTLTPRREGPPVPLRILLIDYTESEYLEKSLASPEQCRPFLEKDNVTWIHVQGDAEPETMRQLGHLFGLHNLALEDVINIGQRPKIDEYNEQLFVVMAHPLIDNEGEGTSVHQLSLFLGRNFVISFHPGDKDPFDPVRKRLRDRISRIRERGADYLLYALIDLVIDDGFPVLEWLGDEIEELEEEMLETPTNADLKRLYQLKRSLVILRRVLWPQREVLNHLVRGESTQISEGTKIYFRDCYDHTIQIMDLIESYRDMATGLLDVYLSSVSYRLNEIMRVLTVIATIFIPLTFIVGVYGMNFVNAGSPWAMPELRWYYGYPLVWLLMIIVAAGMLIYFRKRRWF